ncbi:MAG: fibronectin type III domain-containing protein [Thermoplasmata archaeon]|nr:MAG: fibronectin type III domain-containing protein [Thermoplasmata archaeon]
MLILTNFMFISFIANKPASGCTLIFEAVGAASSRAEGRSGIQLGFTNISTGLPQGGDYNYIAMGDFNNDTEIDIAFGGEDWDVQDTVGLYAYTGNGGINWTDNSTGLWPGNSWGGLQLVDADEDGSMELYATDEDWGTKNSSGVHPWEFRNNKWTDSAAHVSSPVTSGQPCNVVFTNVTGDSRLDMVVCTYSGMKYYENKGGNPATWLSRSGGLPTSSWYTGVAVEDMNKDGLKDIICVRNDQERMFVQQASGTLWKEYSSGLSVAGYVLGVVAADLNQDTHMDIIFASCTPSDGNGIKVWLGNSGGSGGTSFTWTAANTGLPTSRRYSQIQAVDIDLDGDLDIIGPCASGSEGMKIFLGNGTTKPGKYLGWTEAENTKLPKTGNWYGANCYDINGDGSLDIVGASWGLGVRAWLNNLSKDTTPPGGVSDLKVVEATSNSIKVSWSAPADNGTDASSGPVSNYDIRYSTSSINIGNWANAVRCDKEPVPASPGTTEEFNITELDSATLYYIALRSEDDIPNLSSLSNVVFNTTLGLFDIKPPGKIIDLFAGEPTNNSINLSWSAPADNASEPTSGPVSEYDIRYYTFKITELNWPQAAKCTAAIIPGSPGSTETYTVSNLLPETKYYFAIKARDERPNWGPLSNSPHETTLPDPDITPPGAVTDLTASNPTTTTIDLSWTAPGNDGGIGTAAGYDIRYSVKMITDLSWESATPCTGEPTPAAAGTKEQFQVTGLSPDTTYYFALKIFDEAQLTSPLSNIAQNRTLPLPDEIPPGAVIDLSAGSPTYTSVTLSWTAPGDDGGTGTAAAYDIRYAAAAITSSNWGSAMPVKTPPVPASAGSAETFEVTGLEHNTTYFFAIKSVDEWPNWSPVSNSPSATTLDPVVVIPELLVLVTPEKTELDSLETIQLAVQLRSTLDELQPVEQASVELQANHPGLSINPPEGISTSDGVLNSELTAPFVESVTEITIEAKASKEGFLANSSSISIMVLPLVEYKKFNLRITKDDITLSQDELEEGEEVTIYANITNIGERDANDFTVIFYIDSEGLGTPENFKKLKQNGFLIVEKNFTTSAGVHTIRVEVIPDYTALEFEMLDNSAEIEINVKNKEKEDDTDTSEDDTEKVREQKSSSDVNYLIVFIVILIVMIVIGLVMILMNRRRKRPEPPAPLPEPSPAPPEPEPIAEPEEVLQEQEMVEGAEAAQPEPPEPLEPLAQPEPEPEPEQELEYPQAKEVVLENHNEIPPTAIPLGSEEPSGDAKDE